MGRSAHAVTRKTQGEVIDKHVEGRQAYCSLEWSRKIFTDDFTEIRTEGIYTPETFNAGMADFSIHCKKRLAIFPPAGMSLTKLFLAGNY